MKARFEIEITTTDKKTTVYENVTQYSIQQGDFFWIIQEGSFTESDPGQYIEEMVWVPIKDIVAIKGYQLRKFATKKERLEFNRSLLLNNK